MQLRLTEAVVLLTPAVCSDHATPEPILANNLHEENARMARRRGQNPTLQRSKTKEGRNDRWWYTAYVDVRNGPGDVSRVEKDFTLGYCRDMNKRQAVAALSEAVSELNRKPNAAQSQAPFGEVLDEFIKLADVRDNTRRQYESVVNAHIRPRWGDVRICDIKAHAVHTWVFDMAKGMTKNTVVHVRRYFSMAWKAAVLWEYTEKANPMALIPKTKNAGKPDRKKTLPTPELYQALLAHLEGEHRNIVIVAAETGLRIGEIMALRWGQMRGIYLEVTESMDPRGKVGPVKSKDSERMIPIAHLRLSRPAGKQDSDFVFTSNYDSVRRGIQKAARSVGIYYEGFGPHTFRRLHNTLFRRMADVDLAQKQLGHSDRRTNDGYFIEGIVELEKRAEVVGRFGEVLGGRVN